MKKIIVFSLFLGLMFPLLSGAEEVKIGYVDIFEVFNSYEKTKEYDAVLEKEREEKEKELDKEKENIKKIQDKMTLLNEKEQEKEQENVSKAVKDYREKERQFVLDLKKDRDEKMKEIIDDINKAIKEYAEKNGFSIVFNKGAILYGKESMDITETILKIVDQRHKK